MSASTPAIDQPAATGRWWIPLVLLICVILSFLDKISVGILVSSPVFRAEMGLSGEDSVRFGLLMTSFLLSYSLASILISGLADRISPVYCLYGMLVLMGVSLLLLAGSTSYREFLSYRILLGVIEGPLFALAYAIVRRSFPPREQARATMLWLLGTPIGAAAGFPLLNWVLTIWGWRTTYGVIAALLIPVLLSTWWVLRHWTRRYGLVAPKVTGATTAPDRYRLFRRPAFWAVCAFNMAFMGYLWGLNSWLPTYLSVDRGVNLEQLGLVASLPFIGMLMGEVAGAWLSDRLDRRALVCTAALGSAALGLLGVLLAPTDGLAIAAMAFSACSWGAAAPSIFPLLAKVTPADLSATAGGFCNGLGNVSGALVPLAMGLLVAQTGTLAAGLTLMMSLALLGALVLLPLVNRG